MKAKRINIMKFIAEYDKRGLTKEEIININKEIDKRGKEKANEILKLYPHMELNLKYEGKVKIKSKEERKYVAYIVGDNFKDFDLL